MLTCRSLSPLSCNSMSQLIRIRAIVQVYIPESNGEPEVLQGIAGVCVYHIGHGQH